MKTLRPYQAVMLRRAFRLLKTNPEVLLCGPTGCGKTLVMQALTAQGFNSVIFLAPQRNIAHKFLPEKGQYGQYEDFECLEAAREIAPGHIEPARKLSIPGNQFVTTLSGTSLEDGLLALTGPYHPARVLVSTHQAACRFEGDLGDLDGVLLIIDEGHHLGSGPEEMTQIRQFKDKVLAAGGKALPVTATPFRSDGWEILSNPDAPKVLRTFVEHSLGGMYAPENYEFQTALLKRSSDTVLDEDINNALIARWVGLGQPYLLVRARTVAEAKHITKVFEIIGAQVLNIAGESEAELEILACDEKSKHYGVVVGCSRLNEGLDWPLASHIFNMGVPTSITLMVQLFGRTLRQKPEDYIPKWKNTANITCFLEVEQTVTEQDIKLDHARAFLVFLCFMQDHITAREYYSHLPRWAKKAAKDSNPTPEGQEELEEDLAAAVDEFVSELTSPDGVSAELTQYEESYKTAEGECPTIEQVVTHFEGQGWTQNRLDQLKVKLLTAQSTLSDEDKAKATAGAAWRYKGLKVAEAYRHVLDGIYADNKDKVSTYTGRVLAGCEAHHALEIADRMRAYISQGPDFSDDKLEAGLRKFHALHGKWPTNKSSEHPGSYGIPWSSFSSLDGALGQGCRGLTAYGSLYRFLVGRGLIDLDPDFSDEELEAGCRVFHTKQGRWPRRSSEENPRDYDIPWNTFEALNAALKVGCRGLTAYGSLSRFLEDRGLIDLDPDFSDDELETGLRRFHGLHGRWPAQSSVQNPRDYGIPWISFRAVDGAIRMGHRGLSKLGSLAGFKRARGLVSQDPDFTDDGLEAGLRRFHNQHGQWPSVVSPECPREYGIPWDSFSALNGALGGGSRGLSKQRSLLQFRKSRGLVDPEPKFSDDELEDSFRKFHALHDRFPSVKSKDPPSDYGIPIRSFFAVEVCLKRGGMGLTAYGSITEFLVGRGLVTRDPDFSDEELEAGCRKYYNIHLRWPSSSSTEDPKAYGIPWSSFQSLSAALKLGHRGLTAYGSLAKFKRARGLV